MPSPFSFIMEPKNRKPWKISNLHILFLLDWHRLHIKTIRCCGTLVFFQVNYCFSWSTPSKALKSIKNKLIFFWNSPVCSSWQCRFALWSLRLLPFLNRIWTSDIVWSIYCNCLWASLHLREKLMQWSNNCIAIYISFFWNGDVKISSLLAIVLCPIIVGATLLDIDGLYLCGLEVLH